MSYDGEVGNLLTACEVLNSPYFIIIHLIWLHVKLVSIATLLISMKVILIAWFVQGLYFVTMIVVFVSVWF